MNFLNRERERERERERRSQVLCWIYGGCKLGAKKKWRTMADGCTPPWALAWRGVWYDSCCVGGS